MQNDENGEVPKSDDALDKLVSAVINPEGNQLFQMTDIAINMPEPLACLAMVNSLGDMLRQRIKENMELAQLLHSGKTEQVKKYKRKELPVLSKIWEEAYLFRRMGIHGDGKQAAVDLIKEHLSTRPIEDTSKGYEFGRSQ